MYLAEYRASLLLVFFLMPWQAVFADDCQIRIAPTAYDIDDRSGIAEYSVTVQPRSCDRGCSGSVRLRAKYAVSKQVTERKISNEPKKVFDEETRNETGMKDFLIQFNWESRNGEEVDKAGYERATTFWCDSNHRNLGVGGICKPLDIKVESYSCNAFSRRK